MFAAEFRDRIVNHLYYNYTHDLYERTFIHDTYSCIKGRGTHFGVKLQLTTAHHGVEFLGAWLKPHRIYVARDTVGRMRDKMCLLAKEDRSKWSASLTSFCGVLSHGANYRLRRRLMLSVPEFTKYGIFNLEYRKYYLGVNF